MSLRNHSMIEHAAHTVRDHLGEDAWRRAWEAGHAMTLDQAIAVALANVYASDDARSTL